MGRGPLWGGVTGQRAHVAHTARSSGASPLSLTGSSNYKFFCSRLTISATPVLLGYAPILEGGTLCLTDLFFHHSTFTRAALGPPSER